MDFASQLRGLQREIERLGGEMGEDLFGDVACTLARADVDWSRPQPALIRRVARCRRIDLFRRQASRTHQSLDALGDESNIASEPNRDLENQQEQDRIWDAVRRLKPKYRAVVQLVYQDDLGEQEVARILGVPRETVRTRLKRAIQQLRQSFNPSTERPYGIKLRCDSRNGSV